MPGPYATNATALAMVEDITARRRIEETLLSSQEQLREQRDFLGVITSNIAEGVYVIDRDGQMLFMNPAAEQMLGWTQVELLGRKAHDIIHIVPPGGETPAVSEVFSTRNAVFRRKDETTLPVSFTSSPIIKNESVTGAVLSFLDRSDQLRHGTCRIETWWRRSLDS